VGICNISIFSSIVFKFWGVGRGVCGDGSFTIESSVFFFNFVVLGAAPLGSVFLFQFCGIAQVMIIHKNI
jgi:hypothetical protein